MQKRIYPSQWDFGIDPVAYVGVGSRGLDRDVLRKRASAFDDINSHFERRPGYEYLHIITSGAFERYGANMNGDAWHMGPIEVYFPHPERLAPSHMMLDGGLEEFHDCGYMDHGAVYKEHNVFKSDGKTKVEASGYPVCARVNLPMWRGELIIGVDVNKWADELHAKALGKPIYFSLGADVDCDVCSICGRKATTMDGHCSHFKNNRLQLSDTGERVFVYNMHPKFYDISGVAQPAEPIACAIRDVCGTAATSTAPERIVMEIDSSNMVKAASLENDRRTALYAKKAALISKLAVMTKTIPAVTAPDPIVEACIGDPQEERMLVNRIADRPLKSVLTSTCRHGILLSPSQLFRLIGMAENTPELASIENSDISMEDLAEALTSANADCSPFDAGATIDENVDRLVEKSSGSLSLNHDPVCVRAIVIKVAPMAKQASVVRRMGLSKAARAEAARQYADYLVSFLAQSEVNPEFALRKTSAIVCTTRSYN